MLHDNAATKDTPLQALLVVFVIRTYEHACSTLNGMSQLLLRAGRDAKRYWVRVALPSLTKGAGYGTYCVSS